jgi:hypothetical protein
LAKPGVVYMHTPGCSVMRLRVGHMHCRLLMARVDDAKILILIRHDIQDRQNMIAGQAEDILNAFELERFCRLNDFP